MQSDWDEVKRYAKDRQAGGAQRRPLYQVVFKIYGRSRRLVLKHIFLELLIPLSGAPTV